MADCNYLRVELVNAACLQLNEQKKEEYKPKEKKSSEGFGEVFEKWKEIVMSRNTN